MRRGLICAPRSLATTGRSWTACVARLRNRSSLLLEPPPGATPLWPRVRIKALFDCRRSRAARDCVARLPLRRTRRSSTSPIARGSANGSRTSDRCASGSGCGSVPADSVRSSTNRRAEPCLIELDPGLAFGTGTHPTTALCLEWLDGAQLQGTFVIDYGCGSGVLAIAALEARRRGCACRRHRPAGAARHARQRCAQSGRRALDRRRAG